VVPGEDKAYKMILLKTAEIPTEIAEALGEFWRTEFLVPITTANFSAEEMLEKILPPGMTIPTGFETIGQIAHYNLRDE
jgi:tRNA G37 N-methylase Trm5